MSKATGREYGSFGDGKSYVLPTDVQEQKRLDSQSKIFDLMLQGDLQLAPIVIPISRQPEPFTVLDIGTGTGIWAQDFAARFPRANVIGIDLKRPETSSIPKNVSFEVGDLERPWRWNREVDFVHGRMLMSCFKDAREVFKHAYAALRPGGYFEMQDLSTPGFLKEGSKDSPAQFEWHKYLKEGGLKLGRPFGEYPSQHEKFMKEIGFEPVKQEIMPWPIGPIEQGEGEEAERQREIGKLVKQNVLDIMDALSGLLLKQALGWSDEKVDELHKRVIEEIHDPDIQTYYNM